MLTGGITAIKCRAVDLYEAGYSPSYTFKVGGRYAFDCSYLGLDEYNTDMRLYQKTTDLAEPYNPELTFILPSSTYKTQVTNERLRIQQKLYAQAKAQADRLDNTSVKKTTSSAYDPTTANPGTVYYVDKGDGTGELMLDGTSYGGGSGTTVENATILDNSNFHDYNIVERMDIAVTPAVNLYYGNLPNFICVQGNFMLYLAAAAATVIDYDNGYIIDGDPTLYGRIIANKDKFGCQIGTDTFGGFLHTQASGKSYPSVYSYVRLELTVAEYNNDKYDYLCRFVEYNAATNAPQPAGANWWETNMQWGNSTATPKNAFRLIGEDNVRGLDGSLQHVFSFPVTRELNYNTSQSSLPTPFGRVSISYWLVFASSNSTDYGITVISAAGATPLQTKVSPFRSQAEKTFSLGLTKRTEPVQPT